MPSSGKGSGVPSSGKASSGKASNKSSGKASNKSSGKSKLAMDVNAVSSFDHDDKSEEISMNPSPIHTNRSSRVLRVSSDAGSARKMDVALYY